MAELWEALEVRRLAAPGRFHMPGHKGLSWPHLTRLNIANDWTELPGLDDLHHPSGILLRLLARTAERWRAGRAWILGNGSTSGLLIALLALASGASVLCSRAVHRSVLHGLSLAGSQVSFLPWRLTSEGLAALPTLAEVRAAWPEGCRLLVFTCPSYEGRTLAPAELTAIADFVHEQGALLLVDAAHGAHFGLFPGWPAHPLEAGADVVVQSLHKMLPAPNPAALLLTRPGLAPGVLQGLGQAYDYLESSSPSYLLLAAVEGLLDYLETAEAGLDFAAWLKTGQALQDLGGSAAPQGEQDPAKLWLRTDGEICAAEARARGLEPEMVMGNGVLWLSGLRQDCTALAALVRELKREGKLAAPAGGFSLQISTAAPASDRFWEAGRYRTFALTEGRECLPLAAARGRISAAERYLYPPGIPVLLPGEQISEAWLAWAGQLAPGKLLGGPDGALEVLAEPESERENGTER